MKCFLLNNKTFLLAEHLLLIPNVQHEKVFQFKNWEIRGTVGEEDTSYAREMFSRFFLKKVTNFGNN